MRLTHAHRVERCVTARPVACAAVRPPSVDALARSIADVGLPHPLLVDAARAAIAVGRPGRRARDRRGDAPGDVAAGHQRHRRAAAHEPRARAARRSRSRPTTRTSSCRSPPASGGRAATTPARCWPEPAAPKRRSSSTTVPPRCCSRSPRSRAAAGVAVSRGELVEIGGGFRIPEVMEESGARLVEVGTTNRTRVADYERVAADVELILKVHQSNYRITGFTEDAAVEPLAAHRSAGRRRPRVGPARRRLPVAGRRSAAVAARRARRTPDARRRRRARRLLGRQAPRRSAGRHPRRPRRPRRRVRPPSAVSGAAPRRPRARRAAAGRARVPRAATATRLPFWRMATVAGRRAPPPCDGARRGRGRRVRVGDRRRHRARGRDPVGRRRRSTATSPRRCAPREPKPVDRPGRGRPHGARPPHRRPADDDLVGRRGRRRCSELAVRPCRRRTRGCPTDLARGPWDPTRCTAARSAALLARAVEPLARATAADPAHRRVAAAGAGRAPARHRPLDPGRPQDPHRRSPHRPRRCRRRVRGRARHPHDAADRRPSNRPPAHRGPEEGVEPDRSLDPYDGVPQPGVEHRFVRGEFGVPGPATDWIRLRLPSSPTKSRRRCNASPRPPTSATASAAST